MKITAALIVVIALVAALYYSVQQQRLPVPDNQQEESAPVSQQQQVDLPKTNVEKAQEEATAALPEPREREEQIAETKAKLDALMMEYNDNLKNPQAKKELESQIALLMDEYNALILPIAVEKVKQTALPET